MTEGSFVQRVAAILAADAVGYSRLMATDETATIAALEAARDVFRSYIESGSGRIVDTAGDSVLAVFETTAGAVQTAEAIRDALAAAGEGVPDERRMRFRIGIHVGDIHEKSDGSIYGDGVNIAARIQALAAAGEVAVSGAVRESIRDRLGLTFADLGEHTVKNIADPVRAYQLLAPGATAPAPTRRRRRAVLIGAGFAVAVALLSLALWHGFSEPAADAVLALPDGPVVAVLPFENLTGDSGQDYFVDGLVDNIITGLALFPDLFVIARGSTFTYKGRATDVRDVRRDLGAAYVVEGSVQRSPDSIRVVARLHDAESGTQLWSQTYDRALTADSVFAIQDDIKDQIAAMVGGSTGMIARHAAGTARSHGTDSLAAYECVLLAGGHYDIFTSQSHLRARDCLERTVAADPDYADAWAWLTYLYADEDAFAFNPGPDPLARSLEAGLRAGKLDPASAIAHSALARTHAYRQEWDDFFVHAERAVALNPNNVFVIVDMGQFMTMLGKPERGAALVGKAMKLNPYHQGWYYIGFFYRHYGKGEYEEALAMAQKMNLPDLWYMHAFLAAANAQLGRQDEAQAAVAALLSLYPEFEAEAYAQFRKRLASAALVDDLVAGLRKAGLAVDTPQPPGRSAFRVPSPGVTKSRRLSCLGRAVCQVPLGTTT
ncbi:MAG: adenylate/guanylate cyclase domain-containing protein [Alphaproteobacteria bacterium]|nr:adenylate/guanylate cyclase domain-containing protein [Alphaproteobacteria bacterium]